MGSRILGDYYRRAPKVPESVVDGIFASLRDDLADLATRRWPPEDAENDVFLEYHDWESRLERFCLLAECAREEALTELRGAAMAVYEGRLRR